MKQLITFSLLIIMTGILMPGCKKNKEKEPEPASGEMYILGLAVHQSFENDQVNIYIDGQSVFNKKVTTNPSLSLAGGTKLDENAGNHTIKVVVNGRAIKSANFTTTKDLYIGIDYNKQSQNISFVFRDEPFVYD